MGKHFVNDPDDFTADALGGYVDAHRRMIRLSEDPRFVHRAEPSARAKVALVSGGGSGHEPLHVGYVGAGMLDAAVPGEIFASPTAEQIRAATALVANSMGAVHVVKNYTGDVLNFSIASELLRAEGTEVGTVLVDDDLATGADGTETGRRGTAAVLLVEKICGAVAEAGAPVADVVSIGQRVAGSARTLSVALRPCTRPGSSQPSFDLGDDEVEFGVGIHGERGIDRTTWLPATETVDRLASPIAEALQLHPGDAVFAIVNGLGATTLLELGLMHHELSRLLQAKRVTIARSLLGTYVSALDMAGCSVTLARADDELLRWWDAPVRTPMLAW